MFGRTTRRILVVLSLLALRIGLLRPICAVARRPGDEPGESVLDLVREQHERGTSTRGDGLSLLLFTPGVSPLNKVLGYVLADREVRPRFVVKLGRVDQAEQALMQEAATLEAIETTRPLAGAPSVVFLDHRHRTVLAETFLDGTPLTTMLSPTRHLELALKATDWLVDLAAGRPPEARDRWWSRLVEAPLEETLPVVEPELSASGVRHLRERLACLADLPLVPEQRDCAPWNILLDDRGDLVVHDWESAEPEGLPYLDLAYFLSYSAFLLDGALESGRLSASYRASLDPSTPAGAVNAACTDRYVNRLGLDPLVLPALRSLTWVVHLRSTCARLGAARGRQSPFVSLLREELHAS